jgi:glycosyltransferase involved in cell wall biosynthesis
VGRPRRPRLTILTGLDVRAFRGGEKYAANLGRQLVARGVDVRLFSKVDPNEHLRLDDRTLKAAVRLPVDFYALLWLPRIPPVPLRPVRFLRELRASDTIFTLDGTPRHVALVVLAGRLIGRRVVVGLHSPTQVDDLAREITAGGIPALRARVFRAVLRRADVVHTINTHQAETLRAIGLGSNVAMVNSFTTAEPQPAPPRAPGTFEALFVGPLEREQKGIDLLVEVGRRALRSADDLRLTVVGAGRDEGLVRSLADEFPDRVRHLGFVDEMELASTYAAADLLWMTSRAESFSLVALEAFTQGVPVVCFAVPGLADVTSIFPEGRVPCYDVEAFTAAVLGLRELARQDPAGYDRLRERLRAGALEQFGAAVQVPKLATMLGLPIAASGQG